LPLCSTLWIHPVKNGVSTKTVSFETQGRQVRKNGGQEQLEASTVVLYHGCPGFIDLRFVLASTKLWTNLEKKEEEEKKKKNLVCLSKITRLPLLK